MSSHCFAKFLWRFVFKDPGQYSMGYMAFCIIITFIKHFVPMYILKDWQQYRLEFL